LGPETQSSVPPYVAHPSGTSRRVRFYAGRLTGGEVDALTLRV